MGTGASTKAPIYTQEVNSDGSIASKRGVTTSAVSGGLSQFPYMSTTAANVNAAVVKASAATLYGYHFSNSTTSWMYVHMYNKATTPVPGTDIAVRVVAVPPGGAITYNGTDIGLAFSAGLSVALTSAAPLNDNTTTNIAANGVVGMLDYV